MANVKPAQLSSAIAETLDVFQAATEEALLRGINTTAERAAEIVRIHARRFGDNYAQDITARKGRAIRGRSGAKIQAYVTAGDHYRVAHLLEHGHAIVTGGRVTGFVEGYEHFARGEDYVELNVVENIKKEMQQ